MFESRDYISDFESETTSNLDAGSEISQSDIPACKDKELWEKPTTSRFPAYGDSKAVLEAENKKAYNSVIRHHLLNLNAFDRHKRLINDYLQYYGGSWKDFQRDTSKDKTDVDVIREHGRFLWSEEDEPTSWSERLAKKYWEKLFKEYCLVDLSRYKENKFGMRWRLEKEVISGKGQFTCGNVACPAGSERLRSWEVNFVYQERGERRNALVKIRLCPPCSEKLNYRYRLVKIFNFLLRQFIISSLFSLFF
ncbi:Protein FRA10AC1 like [Schistosoma japonicum]|nr:Protein FRA10AC1 like [Schistosoma japonicum]